VLSDSNDNGIHDFPCSRLIIVHENERGFPKTGFECEEFSEEAWPAVASKEYHNSLKARQQQQPHKSSNMPPKKSTTKKQDYHRVVTWPPLRYEIELFQGKKKFLPKAATVGGSSVGHKLLQAGTAPATGILIICHAHTC
jgi:hypothetical protein